MVKEAEEGNGAEYAGEENNQHGQSVTLPAVAAREYTEEQIRAIKADPERDALLVALAGVGKTSVAAWQVAYVMKYRHFEPRHIVALSYSVRAADSLRNRITRTIEDKMSGPVIGMAEMGVNTLHAWAAKLLRDRVRRYARYEIFNEATRRRFVQIHFDEIGLGRIPRRRGKQATLTSQGHDIALFLDVCDRLREERVPADGRLGPDMLAAYRAYLNKLDSAGAWDFTQILPTLHDALTAPSDADCLALQWWVQDKLRLLLVDEAQDLGAGEWAVLDRLHELGTRLWLVADGRQRIFSFRSADGAYLDRFVAKYGAAIYSLTMNFRSTDGIVSLANAFLRTFLWPRTDSGGANGEWIMQRQAEGDLK